MAYATDEDRAFFAERGWYLDPQHMCWHHTTGDLAHARTVVATWQGSKPGNLSVPPPERVFWAAASVTVEGDASSVVLYRDQCASPITCFVLAELREWKSNLL